MSRIAVVGLGYVGLPLALQAEVKGFEVVGIDLSKKKLDLLKQKKSPIDDEISTQRLLKSKIKFSDDFSKLKDVDIAVICVPTPVNDDKMPDLSIVKNASISAAKFMKNGGLLVVESTINPGVCDEIIIPAIESETKHKVGKTLHIAHCPERINPGDPKWHVGNIARVLGANSDEALEIAYRFYTKLVDAQIKKMDTIKEAEACKVVENSFRDINIAFVNELAMSFEKLGINVVNVIDGAATKPFAFMPHYPGIGVGGHCIPVDPYYLIEYAKVKGFDHDFLKLARSINEGMPVYSINMLEQSLIEAGHGTLEGKLVAVLGLSYKANVADDRESPSYVIIENLKKRGAEVNAFDPHILDKSNASSLNSALNRADAAILVTAHKEFLNVDPYNSSKIKFFIDGRNSINKDKLSSSIKYLGIGS